MKIFTNKLINIRILSLLAILSLPLSVQSGVFGGANECIPSFVKVGSNYKFYGRGPAKVLEKTNGCWLKIKTLRRASEILWINVSVIPAISNYKTSKK
jgi:hypothetical protein